MNIIYHKMCPHDHHSFYYFIFSKIFDEIINNFLLKSILFEDFSGKVNKSVVEMKKNIRFFQYKGRWYPWRRPKYHVFWIFFLKPKAKWAFGAKPCVLFTCSNHSMKEIEKTRQWKGELFIISDSKINDPKRIKQAKNMRIIYQ